MADRPAREITPDEVEQFATDGVVCLKGVMPARWLAVLEDGIKGAMASSGRYTRRQSDDDDPGLFFSDYGASARVPALMDYALHSPAGEIAATILKSRRANFLYDAVWVKEPGTAKPSAWHQDQPYYAVDGRQICIMWVPIDPVPPEVVLRCVRGSHLWGSAFKPIRFKDLGDFGRDVEDGYPPPPDIERDHADAIFAADMTPGDVLVFQGMCVHGAPGNSQRNVSRRAVATTWVGDDAVYVERPGEMEPDFSDRGLKPGDPLDAPAFPRVFERA